MKLYKNKKGFMIIELVVAISVTAVILVAMISALVFSLQSSAGNKYRIQAVSLAEEQLEGIKNIQQNNWYLLPTNGNYYAKISTSTNQWVLETGTTTISFNNKDFTVGVEFEQVERSGYDNGHAVGELVESGGFIDDDSLLVKASVLYTDKQGDLRTEELTTLLTSWKQSFIKQSTIAEFQTGTFDNTEIISNGDGAIELTSGGAGGMQALYHFSEDTGTQTADSSGNGNIASLQNSPTWEGGRFGSGIEFDGNSNYLEISNADSLNMTDELTIEAWIKWDIDPSTGQHWAQIINKNGDNQYQLQHSYNNDHFEFAVQTDSNRRYVSSDTSPMQDEWYHVVGTYDGSDIKLYVNGQLERQSGLTGNVATSTSPVNIGRRAVYNDRYFSGVIDEVSIHDHALTATEILAHYDACPEVGANAPFQEVSGQVVVEAENYHEKVDRGSSNMTAYYKLNNEDSIALDISGNNLNGNLINGASRTSGVMGRAVQFDGSNDYIDINHNSILNFTNELTLEVWIKWDIDPSTGQHWAQIINKNGDNQYQLQHSYNNDHFEFAIRTDVNRRYILSSTTPQQNEWYHVVGTYDGSDMRLYVNGQLENQTSLTGNVLTSASNLNIGRRSHNNDRYFEGTIDEVVFYSQALSDAEVLDRYNLINNIIGNSIISRWQMEENSGIIAGDSVDSNHGNITGASWDVGFVESALSFDGNNDYALIPHDNTLSTSDSFSLAAWVYIPSSSSAWKGIIHKENDYTLQFIDNDSIRFMPAGYAQVDSPANAITRDSWNFIVGTLENSSDGNDYVKLYINGQEVASNGPIWGTPQTSNNDFITGAAGTASNVYNNFFGKIDEIKIYNSNLTTQSVLDMYDSYINYNTSRLAYAWQDNSSQVGYEGTGYEESLPDSGSIIDSDIETQSPELKYKLYIDNPGTYYVWVRGFAQGSGGQNCADNDSIHIGLDGSVLASADKLEGFCSPEGSWQWQNMTTDGNSATIDITSSGEHMLNVWMREYGFLFDRIIITTNSSFVPSGAGPTESDRYNGSSCSPLYSDLGGYFPLGTYTSHTFDTGSSNTVYNLAKLTAQIPTHTNIRFRFAAKDSDTGWVDSDFLGPDNTTTTYYQLPELINRIATAGKRYLCYRAYLTTNSATLTPSLEAIEISYTP